MANLRRTSGVSSRAVVVMLLLCGCMEQTPVGDKPISVAPGFWTRRSFDGLYVTGTRVQLCVRIPDTYALDYRHHDINAPDGTPVRVKARLFTAGGKIIDFGSPYFILSGSDSSPLASLLGGKDSELCFQYPSESIKEELRAIELTSSAKIIFERVSWWSGSPQSFL